MAVNGDQAQSVNHQPISGRVKSSESEKKKEGPKVRKAIISQLTWCVCVCFSVTVALFTAEKNW